MQIAHDDNGNMELFGSTDYEYDIENRLIGVDGGVEAYLVYDAKGRLHQLTIDGETTHFLYDGDSLIGEYENGALVNRYVHSTQVDTPLVSYVDGAVSPQNRRFLHRNHQGSIIAKSDQSGSVTTINTYDAFGNPGSGNEGRFGYTGQMALYDLGLYHYRARAYSPRIGRFLQTDPVGYEDQMNLYAYVHNDPLNANDPTGMTTEEIVVTGTRGCGCSMFRDAWMDIVMRGPGEVGDYIQNSARNRVLAAKVGAALVSDMFSEGGGTESTPDADKENWEKIPGSRGAYRPKSKKEPVFEKDRAGDRSHGGSKWKKWNKSRDWKNGKRRDGTYDEKGKRLRD